MSQYAINDEGILVDKTTGDAIDLSTLPTISLSDRLKASFGKDKYSAIRNIYGENKVRQLAGGEVIIRDPDGWKIADSPDWELADVADVVGDLPEIIGGSIGAGAGGVAGAMTPASLALGSAGGAAGSGYGQYWKQKIGTNLGVRDDFGTPEGTNEILESAAWGAAGELGGRALGAAAKPAAKYAKNSWNKFLSKIGRGRDVDAVTPKGKADKILNETTELDVADTSIPEQMEGKKREGFGVLDAISEKGLGKPLKYWSDVYHGKGQRYLGRLDDEVFWGMTENAQKLPETLIRGINAEYARNIGEALPLATEVPIPGLYDKIRNVLQETRIGSMTKEGLYRPEGVSKFTKADYSKINEAVIRLAGRDTLSLEKLIDQKRYLDNMIKYDKMELTADANEVLKKIRNATEDYIRDAVSTAGGNLDQYRYANEVYAKRMGAMKVISRALPGNNPDRVASTLRNLTGKAKTGFRQSAKDLQDLKITDEWMASAFKTKDGMPTTFGEIFSELEEFGTALNISKFVPTEESRLYAQTVGTYTGNALSSGNPAMGIAVGAANALGHRVPTSATMRTGNLVRAKNKLLGNAPSKAKISEIATEGLPQSGNAIVTKINTMHSATRREANRWGINRAAARVDAQLPHIKSVKLMSEPMVDSETGAVLRSFYDSGTGEIFVNPYVIKGERELREEILGQAIGKAGVMRIAGDDYPQILKNIARREIAEVRKLMKAKGYGEIQAAEEILQREAIKTQKKPWFLGFRNTIVDRLKQEGVDASKKDIDRLLARSLYDELDSKSRNFFRQNPWIGIVSRQAGAQAYSEEFAE